MPSWSWTWSDSPTAKIQIKPSVATGCFSLQRINADTPDDLCDWTDSLCSPVLAGDLLGQSLTSQTDRSNCLELSSRSVHLGVAHINLLNPDHILYIHIYKFQSCFVRWNIGTHGRVTHCC